ncbi:MAG: hypothetical protein WCE25_05390 [Nitrososphaeraceae archaeon]
MYSLATLFTKLMHNNKVLPIAVVLLITTMLVSVRFTEEGTYLGNDHDMGHLLIGGGFVVLAANNSSIEH